MFKNRREKILFFTVLVMGLAFGSVYFKDTVLEAFAMTDDMEQIRSDIAKLQQMRAYKLRIEDRYTELESELNLPGNPNEQFFAIREELGKILNEVGLQGKYSQINLKDPELEEDFKIVSITIEQIVCTPKELGQLLYKLEKTKQVMEVDSLSIQNLVQQTGQISRVGNNPAALVPDNGLLRVDLQVARLIGYATGETPKKKGGRT